MANDNIGRETADLTDIQGVGSWTADSLREAGFSSIEDVREASADELTEVEGIGQARAAEISDHAEELAGGGEKSTAESDEAGESAEATATTDGGKTAGEKMVSEEEKKQEEAEAEQEEAETEEESEIEELEIETEGDEDIDLNQIRDVAQNVAETHIEEPYEGVIEINRDDDGWYAVVEVIERSAVPDTQDILGQYEIGIDTSGSVRSYRLVDRYRRGTVSKQHRW